MLSRLTLIIPTTILLFGCWSEPLRLNDPRSELVRSIESTIPQLMDEHDVPAVSIVVIRNGDIELSHSFGFANSLTQHPASEETVFEVASLGKPVLAYLAVKLASNGLFDLDRPLTQYVPNLFAKSDPRLQAITARMILSHSSGLPNYGTDAPEKLTFDPRDGFQYSGVGIARLQTVIEQLSGKLLNELAKEYVFEPLGMNSTSFLPEPEVTRRLALGHDKNGKQLSSRQRPAKAEAAWSLYSTAADYAAFVAFIIQQNATQNNVVMMMLKPQRKITEDISWGLGWGLQSTTPNPSFWHWGSNPGYRSYVVGYPLEQIAVVILSNSDSLFKNVDEMIRSVIGGELPSYDWF